MRPFTRSSSGLVMTSGTITSGMTACPVALAACTAASKMARACISAISGKATARRQPRKPSIGLNSCSSAARRFSLSAIGAHGRRHLGDLLVGVRQELVQRRIEQADGDGQAAHDREQLDEVAALDRQELGQRRAAALLVVGEDHLAHGDDALALEEHVLGAAEPDALRAEARARSGRRAGSRRWRAPSCGAPRRPSPSAC